MIRISRLTILLLLILSISLVIPFNVSASTSGFQGSGISQYFDSIKGNPDALFDFFYDMPKGGDIHLHLL